MALVVKDRVRETTTTTGTGTVTLAGAVAGFQSFSVIGNGNTTYYTITNNVDWEVGIGTYTSSGTTLSRDTILESSNGGAAVNFGAGTKDVFVTYPAEKAVYYDASDNVGIGTSSPGTRLQVRDAAAPSGFSSTSVRVTRDNYGADFVGYIDQGVGHGAIISTVNNGTPTERMRIDSSGNLLVGSTSTPSGNGTNLQVANSGAARLWLTSTGYRNFYLESSSGSALQFVDATAGAERMRIDSSGNVGIGTSSPGVALDVAGDAVRVTRAVSPAAFLGRQGNGTLASPTATVSGNQIVALAGSGHNGSAYTATPSAAMRYLALENFTATANGAAITFETTPIGSSTAARAERMRIDGSGNVGIGTSSPAKRLEVRGNGSNAALRLKEDASYGVAWDIDVGSTNQMLFTNNAGSVLSYAFINGNVGIGTSSPGFKLDIASGDIRLSNTYGIRWGSSDQAFIFGDDGASGGFLRFGVNSEWMRITDSGNVGIGTSSPGVKLDVAGSVRVSNTSSVQFRNAAGSGVAYMTLQSDDNFVVYNAAGAPIQSFTQGATNNAIYGSNANNRMVVDSGTPVTYWTVNGSERMRIDSSGNVGIGTSSPGSRLNVKGGMTWVQNFNGSASSPTEAIDWPVPALNVTSYGDFTLQTMMTFTLPNDGNYFTGDSVWNFRLEQTASSTTSAGVSGMRFMGPGYLMLGAGQTERMKIESGGHIIFGPYASSSSSGNVTNIELKNNGGTGDSNLAAMSFHCQGYYGTHLGLRADGYLGAGGWSASAWRWYVYMPTGDMTAAGNVTAYSDPRLKEDVQPISGALDTLRKLDGVRFRWKEQEFLGHSGAYDYGVLADQVQAVLPEIVADSMHEAPEGDRYKTVAYDKLVPVLLEAIKELEARVAQLEEK